MKLHSCARLLNHQENDRKALTRGIGGIKSMAGIKMASPASRPAGGASTATAWHRHALAHRYPRANKFPEQQNHFPHDLQGFRYIIIEE